PPLCSGLPLTFGNRFARVGFVRRVRLVFGRAAGGVRSPWVANVGFSGGEGGVGPPWVANARGSRRCRHAHSMRAVVSDTASPSALSSKGESPGTSSANTHLHRLSEAGRQ